VEMSNALSPNTQPEPSRTQTICNTQTYTHKFMF